MENKKLIGADFGLTAGTWCGLEVSFVDIGESGILSKNAIFVKLSNLVMKKMGFKSFFPTKESKTF